MTTTAVLSARPVMGEIGPVSDTADGTAGCARVAGLPTTSLGYRTHAPARSGASRGRGVRASVPVEPDLQQRWENTS